MSSIEKTFLGDSCLVWSWGMSISQDTCFRVLRAYRHIKEDTELLQLGVLDTVPAYSSLAVYVDPAVKDLARMQERIEELLAGLGKEQIDQNQLAGESYRFPVVYDGEDLGRVASNARLSDREVVEYHTKPVYTVAMIGFIPHFPYLIGLDERLTTPRLDSPRKRVPAGSVAIGGAQTGIYPTDSPGGWNLIGRTDLANLSELRPGDSLIFYEVASL
jgi:inhibitor of KinA